MLPAPARAAPLLLALALADACAVGPDFKKPEVVVAETWLTHGDPRIATQAAVDGLWWKAFNDPALDRLVDLAYRQNLPLQIAGLRIVEARAQLGIASGRQFPQLQIATASASAIGLSKNAANTVSFDHHFLDYQLGFDAIWEMDFWGKYRRGVEAGSSNLLATVADYYSALVSLTAEVARTYALVRTFEVLIEQARSNVKVQEDGLRIAQSRFRNGATSELDVTQATTLVESTRATVPDLLTKLQQAKNALSTLLGQTVGSIDPILAGPKEIPKAPARVAASVPAELLRRRPDIRSAELHAAAQCARIGIAKADLYPSFSLFGSIGLQAGTSGGTARNLFEGDSLFYTFGPHFTWPFFNYGRITNNVRVEDARFQQLLVDYRSTVLRAAEEVEDALAGLLNAEDAVVFVESSVTAAQKSVELSLVQYQEGAVDYQRVLDAERSLLLQQNDLAETRSTIVINLVALHKALGGGWELGQNQPIIPERTQREMKERTDWGDMLSEPRSPETKTAPAGRE